MADLVPNWNLSAPKIEARDLVLTDSFEGRSFSVKLRVMAENNPALLTNDREPLIVGHLVSEALLIVGLDRKRRSHALDFLREATAKTPIKVER